MLETSVKDLLDGATDLLLKIFDIKEGQTFDIEVTDCLGTRDEVETDLERAKSISSIVIESYLMEIYEKLGYESK
ncbi:hypothetical protein ACWOAH_09750 [Vagococcus vulneris]|uniref:Uncharacterized protein n=1 Tax=Vagococcus vulneris TaxID=1977869 RepID=A0A429ZTZ9_9ENTE|nr:hypothetical protein [Vagococcus vulneris]RST97135.1 hypothetical protein CBF37_10160 [Vagococcus vulneris]